MVFQGAILVAFNLVGIFAIFPAFISLDLRRVLVGKVDLLCCYNGQEEANKEEEDDESNKIPQQQQQPMDAENSSSSSSNCSSKKAQHNSTLCPPDERNFLKQHQQQTKNYKIAAEVEEMGEEEEEEEETVARISDAVFPRDKSTNNLVKKGEENELFPPGMEETSGKRRKRRRRRALLDAAAVVVVVPPLASSSSFSPYEALNGLARNHFGYWVSHVPTVKVFATLLCVGLTLCGVWGVAQVKDGLDLTDVIPRNTSVFDFLRAQQEYFSFYNVYVVTQGHFEYPENQKLLYDYHNSFVAIPNIIKDDNGGLPEFWLSLFRKWLLKLQSAFDDDLADGAINIISESSGYWHPNNASEAGILAFKLLVQTGHVDYPVDKTLLGRNRLVDSHGIINPSAFYNYLSAWYSNDAMAYSYSQVNIVPTPKEWLHDARDTLDLRVPKSQPIVFAQIPFYLSGGDDGGDNDDDDDGGDDNTQQQALVKSIKLVRKVCDKFTEKGLPNFPRGLPFTFWEQYLSLWVCFGAGGLLALTSFFLLIGSALVNFWIATLLVVGVGLVWIQIFGLFVLLGIKFSAISAALLIVSSGITLQFSLQIAMVSTRNKRVLCASTLT